MNEDEVRYLTCIIILLKDAYHLKIEDIIEILKNGNSIIVEEYNKQTPIGILAKRLVIDYDIAINRSKNEMTLQELVIFHPGRQRKESHKEE